MAIDDFRVNGNQMSWGSLIFKVANQRFYGFTALSYDEKLTRTLAYGSARHHAPRGRSAGKYEPGVIKVTGWKASVQALRAFLATQSPTGTNYGNVVFYGLAQYVEASEIPLSVEFDRCVWASNTSSDEENPDPLKEDFEIQPMLIRRNGLELFDSSEGTP